MSIDRRERIDAPDLALMLALQGLQSRMWTALPGIVNSYDPAHMTCSVQPALQARQTLPDGSQQWATLPLLIECPVVFPGGGGFTLTFPLQPGDECLVVFSSRCLDYWWQLGDVQQQAELRMHDLSDGFVLPGVRSLPRVISSPSTTAVQLRSDDGLASLSIAPNHQITVTTTAPVSVTARTVTVTATEGIDMHGMVTVDGDLNVLGNATATAVNATTALTVAGLNMGTHVHPAGTPNTGGPSAP